ETKNSSQPAAHLHRATRTFAQGGHDFGRRIGGPRKTPEATPRPTNDPLIASSACGRTELFPGAARFPPHLSGDLCEPRRGRRSKRRAAGYSDPARRAPDAVEESAGPSAAGADLSGISRAGRSGPDHGFRSEERRV